jgi:hypothetical protein
MTAARQERKSRDSLAFAMAILAVVMLAAGFGLVAQLTPSRAATTELVVVNRYTGLAIDGFDPVAYFVDAKPTVGRGNLEFRFRGATWRFSNEGNRAAFAASPSVYAPRFGGHDPMAVARGAATPGHPEIWLIAEQRLYLFYSAEARAAFAKAPHSAIEAAERNWPDVQRGLAQ